MKIKIFASLDAMGLERSVNEFIADKKVIDIKYQSFMIPTAYTGNVPNNIEIADRVMIIYEEDFE